MNTTKIKMTDDYHTCIEKIFSVTHYYSSDSIHPWEYFKSIYNDIPIQYRMPLMLDAIYSYYIVNYPEMLEYIYNYINYEETSKLKKKRLANNRFLIKNRVRKDGKIKLYRGLAENSIAPEYAVSYTLNKKVADFFIQYHKSHHGKRFGTTICSLIDIENVLFYSNERKEREVFVIPYTLIDDCVPLDYEDLVYYNKYNKSYYNHFTNANPLIYK